MYFVSNYFVNPHCAGVVKVYVALTTFPGVMISSPFSSTKRPSLIQVSACKLNTFNLYHLGVYMIKLKSGVAYIGCAKYATNIYTNKVF